MKTIRIILTLNITLLFFQCASSKFDKKPPFKILSSNYYSNSPDLHKNTFSDIYIRYISTKNIHFDSLYFRKNKMKIKIKTIGGLTYIYAEFQKNSKTKDFTLDINPIKELKNQIPTSKVLPFNLKEDEAVISYQQKGKTKYFKIKNIQKRDSVTLIKEK